MLLAASEYQLWNAVNKMPLSRVAALLSQQKGIRQTVGEEKTKYLKGLKFCPFMAVFFPSLDEISPGFAYLRIRCHPCPRCQRWTGQTSADQGWRRAQSLSVTHHTSFQRELNGKLPGGKRLGAHKCFFFHYYWKITEILLHYLHYNNRKTWMRTKKNQCACMFINIYNVMFKLIKFTLENICLHLYLYYKQSSMEGSMCSIHCCWDS